MLVDNIVYSIRRKSAHCLCNLQAPVLYCASAAGADRKGSRIHPLDLEQIACRHN